MTTRRHRLLPTGAGGNLGKVLHERLPKYADSLRLSDISNLGEARTGEEIVPCNLADAKTVDTFIAGTDAIMHLGGVSVERLFEETLPANIAGTYNLYGVARRHGACRTVFASSNHTIGFYKQDEVIDSAVPIKPDGYYRLSKAFGEQLASFYFDCCGIETVAIRIGSSFAEAENRRMLVTWPGYDDLEQLIRRALFVSNMGFTVVHGMSNNRDRQWDNHHAVYLGHTPTRTNKTFCVQVEARPPLPVDDPAAQYQSNAFIKADPFGDRRNAPERRAGSRVDW